MCSDTPSRREVTAYLSELALRRLRRDCALVASEVWVGNDKRVDFVGFAPAGGKAVDGHAPASRIERGSFIFCEVKSCMDDYMSGHGLTFEGDENRLVCPDGLYRRLVEEGRTRFCSIWTPDAGGRLRCRRPENPADRRGGCVCRALPAADLLFRMCCCSSRLWRSSSAWMDAPLLGGEGTCR